MVGDIISRTTKFRAVRRPVFQPRASAQS